MAKRPQIQERGRYDGPVWRRRAKVKRRPKASAESHVTTNLAATILLDFVVAVDGELSKGVNRDHNLPDVRVDLALLVSCLEVGEKRWLRDVGHHDKVGNSCILGEQFGFVSGPARLRWRGCQTQAFAPGQPLGPPPGVDRNKGRRGGDTEKRGRKEMKARLIDRSATLGSQVSRGHPPSSTNDSRPRLIGEEKEQRVDGPQQPVHIFQCC